MVLRLRRVQHEGVGCPSKAKESQENLLLPALPRIMMKCHFIHIFLFIQIKVTPFELYRNSVNCDILINEM